MDWKPTYKTPPGRNIASTSHISFPKLGRIIFENASTFTLGSTIKTSENLGLGGPMLLEWSGSGSQRSYQWPVGVCRLSVSKRRKWEYIRHPQGSPTQGSFLEQPSIPTANTMYIICSYNIQEKHVDINKTWAKPKKHIISCNPHIQPSHIREQTKTPSSPPPPIFVAKIHGGWLTS